MDARARQIITLLFLVLLPVTHARAENSWETLTPMIERAASVASEPGTRSLAVIVRQTNDEADYPFSAYLNSRLRALIAMKRPDMVFIDPGIAEINAEELDALASAAPGERPAVVPALPIRAEACLIASYSKGWKRTSIGMRLIDTTRNRIAYDDHVSFRPDWTIKALFDRRSAEAEIAKQTAHDMCADAGREIMRLLREGGEKAASALMLAENIGPFSPCGNIHSIVIDYLVRTKTADEGYRRFIMQSMKDYRTAGTQEENALLVMEMARYLSSDGMTDSEEWEAGLAAMSRLDAGEYRRACLQELIFTAGGMICDDALIIERVDRYFSDMHVTLPAGSDTAPLFADMVQAIATLPPGRGGNTGLLRCFDAHLPAAPLQPENGYYHALKRAYLTEDEPGPKLSLLIHLCRYFNLGGAGISEELLDFIPALDERRPAGDGCGIATAGQQDRDIFIAECGEIITESFRALSDKSQRKKAALFCIRHGIQCREIVPSSGEIVRMLASTDDEEVIDGIELALALPVADEEIESAISRLIESRDRAGASARAAVLEQAVRYCAAKRCARPETAAVLVSLLGSRRDGICLLAADALEAIGEQTAPALMSNIVKNDDFSALLSIMILKRIAPASESVSSLLREKAASTGNRWIAAEALTSLEKNE